MSTNGELNVKLLELLQSKPNGISNDDIQSGLGSYKPEERMKAMNEYIKANRVEILRKGAALIYKIKDVSKSTAEMDNDEKVIYSIIEAGGNTGIWVKDIRQKSNLAPQPLAKILKNMENRKLIKAVKSVSASKKKVYMLFGVEPARSVTGGAWYTESDFETEFVDVLNAQCLRFLNERKNSAQKCAKEGPQSVVEKSYCTVSDVHEFIKKLQISKIDLQEDDLEDILKTVVYDGKAQQIIRGNGVLYRAVDTLLPPEGIIQSPCGICPVINKCNDVGSITPRTCLYMKEWLE